MKVRIVKVCPICGNEIGYVNKRFNDYRCGYCKSVYPIDDIIHEKEKGNKR